MRMRWEQTAFVIVLLLAGSVLLQNGAPAAQQNSRLDLKTTVEKEVKVQEGGNWVTKRVPVDSTGPGDILVYTITYQNTGGVPAVDAQIINPLSRGVIYLAESAEGQDAEITCSVDNGRTWHTPPIMLTVQKPGGIVERTPVPTDRYTDIRWIIKKPLQPGQSGHVSFKVTVK